MAVGTQATSLNGWFGGRCALLMFLCNKGPSNDFFLDDFCRSLLPLSVLPEPLEKVRQLSPFACFLIAPLYTKSGMVSTCERCGPQLQVHSSPLHHQVFLHALRVAVVRRRFRVLGPGSVVVAQSLRGRHRLRQVFAQQVIACFQAIRDSSPSRQAARDGGQPALPNGVPTFLPPRIPAKKLFR